MRTIEKYLWKDDVMNAGWKKIVIDGIDIIEHIARYNIKENKYACILSYVICDHLLSVLYLAMYCAEEDVLDRNKIVSVLENKILRI